MVHIRHQRGVAILEFAFVLPLLLALMVLIADLGRAIMQYNTIAKSTRDAARYLTFQLPGTKITEARNLLVYGNTAGSGDPLVSGLTTSHVPTPTWQESGALPVINTVTVQVSGFTFTPMITSVFGMTSAAFTFSDIVVTMRSAT